MNKLVNGSFPLKSTITIGKHSDTINNVNGLLYFKMCFLV